MCHDRRRFFLPRSLFAQKQTRAASSRLDAARRAEATKARAGTRTTSQLNVQHAKLIDDAVAKGEKELSKQEARIDGAASKARAAAAALEQAHAQLRT